jgi:hypothetical protein
MWRRKIFEARQEALDTALSEDYEKLHIIREKCAEDYNKIMKEPWKGNRNRYTEEILDSLVDFRYVWVSRNSYSPSDKYIKEVVIHQDKPNGLFFMKKCIKIAVVQLREIYPHMAATVARINKQYDEKEQAEEAQRAEEEAERRERQKQNKQPNIRRNKFWMTGTYNPEAYYSIPEPLRDYARGAGLSYEEIVNNILGD